MNGPISSGLAPYEYQDERWSPSAMARDEAGFKAQGDRLGAKLEDGTADVVDVCVYFGFCAAKPSVIRAMVKPEHRHNAMDIDADIRAGIHKLQPSLDLDAHYFIAAVVREFGATYDEQVAA